MSFRGMDGPALIQVKDWSVWLRFPAETSQCEVYGLLREALDPFVEMHGGQWEIRPIWPVEEREER